MEREGQKLKLLFSSTFRTSNVCHTLTPYGQDPSANLLLVEGHTNSLQQGNTATERVVGAERAELPYHEEQSCRTEGTGRIDVEGSASSWA